MQEPEGIPWGRYYDVIKRHSLLILALAAAGSTLGLFAVRSVKPVYDTQVTVWINSGTAQQTGPIRAGQLLPQTSWVDLLRSFAIVDSVVSSLRLNVFYTQPTDSALVQNLESAPGLRPGTYVLRVTANDGQLFTSRDVTVTVKP